MTAKRLQGRGAPGTEAGHGRHMETGNMEAIPASTSETENREGTGQEGAANILMK